MNATMISAKLNSSGFIKTGQKGTRKEKHLLETVRHSFFFIKTEKDQIYKEGGKLKSLRREFFLKNKRYKKAGKTRLF
ncbi:hypothetical protein [Endozoicomonas atrinae]|uniref:hypothetical protein n=1 Tax=Endozoicomonas atrinae TaxID=1333660 RepID=UPI003B00CBC6